MPGSAAGDPRVDSILAPDGQIARQIRGAGEIVGFDLPPFVVSREGERYPRAEGEETRLKYMLMFVEDNDPGERPMTDVMKDVDTWWGKYSQSGAIVGGERLQPAAHATTVRLGGSTPTVVDGPFAETKESIGGFAIVQVPDLDAALAMAKSWPASSSVEIRPIWED